MSRRLAQLLGVLLILYGVGGLVAAAVAYSVAQASFGQIAALADSIQAQQPLMHTDLEQIAATVGDSSTAAGGFADSLDRGQQSMATAAQSMAQLAAGFDQAGQIGQVQILGMQPFLQLGQSLGQSSVQFLTLSTQLQQTADSMGSNVQDVKRVQGDLQDIRARVQTLSTRVDATFVVGTAALRSVRGLELAVQAILAWLVIQSVGWLAAGVALLAFGGRPVHHVERGGAVPSAAVGLPRDA